MLGEIAGFDIELVRRAQAGDENAQAKVIRYFFPMVRKISRSYFIYGGDYEDIFQEGLIGLLGAIRSYDRAKSDNFVKYAKLCVNRSIMSAIKSAGRKKHLPLNSSVDITGETALSYDDPEETVIIRERLGAVNSKIDSRLSELEKNVLDLYLDGLSYKEISVRLGKSAKAVENAIWRIRNKLL